MAFPDPAVDSTAPIDDEATEDPTMPDEPEAPAVNLTPEQAIAVGIAEPKPGDTYTMKVTITGTGEGITGSIEPGSAVLDTPPPDGGFPKQNIKGPAAMGMDTASGFEA